MRVRIRVKVRVRARARAKVRVRVRVRGIRLGLGFQIPSCSDSLPKCFLHLNQPMFYSVQTIRRSVTEEAENEAILIPEVIISLQLCEAINTLTIS